MQKNVIIQWGLVAVLSATLAAVALLLRPDASLARPGGQPLFPFSPTYIQRYRYHPAAHHRSGAAWHTRRWSTPPSGTGKQRPSLDWRYAAGAVHHSPAYQLPEHPAEKPGNARSSGSRYGAAADGRRHGGRGSRRTHHCKRLSQRGIPGKAIPK